MDNLNVRFNRLACLLPKYDSSFCIEHNNHKGLYENISTYVDNGLMTWADLDSKQQSIKSNEIWTAKWITDGNRNYVAADTIHTLLKVVIGEKFNNSMSSLIDEFLDALPSHNCSLTLEHNQHKFNNETVSYWSDDMRPEWKGVDSYQKAVNNDEVWYLQWYPHTPGGFNNAAAPSLNILLDGLV